MSNRDVGILLHGELDRRETLITHLSSECDALRVALAIIERPSAESHNIVTNVIGRKRQTVAPTASVEAKSCDKHPAAEFDRRNKCKACISEYQKAWWAKKKAAASLKIRPAVANDDGGGVRSIMVHCDECGDRFNDAKSMGIHKTRVHFGDSSARRSTLNG